jgi:kynurenine formamidase
VHFLRTNNAWLGHEGVGAAAEFLGIDYHGLQTTHIDALCHTWNEDGGWNGIDPLSNARWDGATRGGVQAWRNGITTRGVLIDVPRHRGAPYVTPDRPVTGEEIKAICAAQGVALEAGDALLVYCGRERWEAEHPAWEGPVVDAESPQPGLDPSCLVPLRLDDVAVLIWDMSDAWPPPAELPWGVHSAIFAFGLSLVDNALLEELAQACAESRTWEFFFSVTPLHLVGGTGSPVNPIAIL